MARGGYFAFLGTVVGVVGNLAISVILARMLGSQGLGVFTIYTVLGAVLVPLISLSIPSAVTKFTAEVRTSNPARLSPVLSTGLGTLVVTGVIGSLLTVFFVGPAATTFYHEPLLGPMLVVMGIALLANMIALFGVAVLQGLEEFAAASVVGGVAVLTNTLVLFFLISAAGLFGAALAGAVAVILHSIVAFVMVARSLRRLGHAWAWRPSWVEARSMLAFVGPLNASSIIARLSALVQNSLVALYVSFTGLGFFRVAGVFHNAILLVPRSLLSPMLPILTSVVASRSEERTRTVLTQLVKLAILLVVPLVGALILALPAAIDFLYGSEFLPALPLAAVLILVAGFTFPNTILGEQYLLASGRTRRAFAVTAYSVGLGLLLIVLLLPDLGTLALPAGALATESSLFGILVVWLGQRRELAIASLVPSFGYLGAASTVSLALVFILPSWLSTALALPYGAGLAAVAAFGLMKAEERTMLLGTVLRLARRKR